jgi:uncharacterized protein YycO
VGKTGIHIPRFEVRRYGPGESVQRPVPGDFLLTHSTGLFSSLIRLGQGLRYRGTRAGYAHWSHAALFIDSDGEIIEAVTSGVQQRNVSVYKDTEYHVIHLLNATPIEREHAVAFAQHCLNDSYGFLTDFSIAITLLLGSRLSFGVDGQMICSGLVSRALERTGAIFPYDSWHMLPADLAEAFNLTPQPGESIGIVPLATTGVTRRSA